MRILQGITVSALAALLLLTQSRMLWSQQPLSKGAPAQPAAAVPVGAATAKPAANVEQPAEPSQTALENNPALRTALEMHRKEPRDYVESILLLIDLGHAEMAKPILADLMKLNVSDQQRVAIVNEFGSEGMLKLS